MTKFVLYNISNGIMYGICDTREAAEKAREIYQSSKDDIYIREVVYLNEDFINYVLNINKNK